MCVLIVKASMRQPPLNCSIQGLELLSDVLFHSQYEELKRRLEIEAEPFPSQLLYVNMVAARVLTILMHFRLSIASQSQDSRGEIHHLDLDHATAHDKKELLQEKCS